MKKISELEQELRSRNFVRIHKSYLINVRYIKKITTKTVTIGECPSKASATFPLTSARKAHANSSQLTCTAKNNAPTKAFIIHFSLYSNTGTLRFL